MGLLKYDHNKRFLTLTLITSSGFHNISHRQRINSVCEDPNLTFLQMTLKVKFAFFFELNFVVEFFLPFISFETFESFHFIGEIQKNFKAVS